MTGINRVTNRNGVKGRGFPHTALFKKSRLF